jgi:hypothetical protein
MALLVKLLTRSRWVDVVSNVISLGLIGLLLRQPVDGLFAVRIPERAMATIKYSVKFALLFIALMTAIELIKSLVLIGRRELTRK